MSYNLEVGLINEFELIVSKEHSAMSIGSGSINVFSTPSLIANMEKAAFNAVDHKLGDEYTTVGTKVNINHIAATPMGMKVIFKAKLINVDKAKLLFEVEAYDEKEKIGFGTHERYIINIEKFMKKANSKIIV